MKSNPKPSSLHFMHSPLKAANEDVSQKPSPYLKAILSGKSRPMSQPRTKPVINPYRENAKHESTKTPFQRLINSTGKLPKDDKEIK